MKRIESVLEKIKAADKVQENQWQDVVARELNEISKDCTKYRQKLAKSVGDFSDSNMLYHLPRYHLPGRPSQIMREGMKFLHLHLIHKEVEFGNIEGYDDIKDLVRRALDRNENYNSGFNI
jgi:hypothetical protein